MSQVQVHFTWARRPSQPTAEALRRVIGGVLQRLQPIPAPDAAQTPAGAEVHVLITDDDQLRNLNRQYRDVDQATDVLSFPDGDQLPSGRCLLGQIAISLDAARRQARQLGHSQLRELEELTLHGMVHLLGHDHERDDGQMNELELELRDQLLPPEDPLP